MANLTINIINQNDVTTNANITLDGVLYSNTNTATSISILDKRDVSIVVEASGYYSYSKVVTMFDENINITIKLVQVITDILNPNYLRPYPYFFTIKDPCSYDVNIYNGSSSPYNSLYYYINNEFKTNQADFVCRFPQHGNYQIKQRMVVSTPCNTSILFDYYFANNYIQNLTNTIEQNLALDTTTNFTLDNIVPELLVDLTLPDLLLDTLNYYSLNKEIVATPTLLITNDHCTNPGLLTYNLYNSNNNLIETVEYSTAALDLTYTFTPSSIGDYRLEVILTDCCNPYKIDIIIPVSDFIIFKPTTTSCKEYNVYNASNTIEVLLSVSSIQGESIAGSVELLPKADFTFTLPDDGTYIVNVIYQYDNVQVNKNYVVTAYCGVEDCLAGYIIDVFCGGDCGCKDTSKLELIINKMNVLMFQYFSHLNELYDFNRSFDVLDDSRLTQFQDADIILKKLQSFCGNSDCGCGCS